MPADLDNDLLVLLADVTRHIRTYADYEAQSLGLTRAQLIILVRLERQPDVSQNELAAVADVTAATNRASDRPSRGARLWSSAAMIRKTGAFWRLRVTPAATSLMHEIDHFRAKLDNALTENLSRRTKGDDQRSAPDEGKCNQPAHRRNIDRPLRRSHATYCSGECRRQAITKPVTAVTKAQWAAKGRT